MHACTELHFRKTMVKELYDRLDDDSRTGDLLVVTERRGVDCPEGKHLPPQVVGRILEGSPASEDVPSLLATPVGDALAVRESRLPLAYHLLLRLWDALDDRRPDSLALRADDSIRTLRPNGERVSRRRRRHRSPLDWLPPR